MATFALKAPGQHLPGTLFDGRAQYCSGLPKWSGTGLLPAWDQKCPLMCALGTKRRVLVHKKFPNRAWFGLSPHLKHGMHLEGALTHLDYKRSWGWRTVSIKPIRKLVWDWSPVAPSDPWG